MTDSQATGKPVPGPRKLVFEPVPFGRHYLIDRISQGGMSDIYLAKCIGASGFQKPVVIKKLLPRYSSKARYVKRFINEAKTLARLNHTNIVQILDMGMIEGEYYIALEYIEGRNVAYMLSKAARTGRLPSAELALHVVMEVSKGLAYSHRRRSPSGEPLMLVHQDINSFNVMVSYEAEVKIIDFGIARMFLDNESMDGLPVAGKLLYFSPEQLQRKPVDRRVDIYGTGVLMYELLTGQRLVQHQETVKATVKAILEMDIRKKVESDTVIRKELHPILIRSMTLDPADRYPWIEEMMEDIRRVIKDCSLELNTSVFSQYMKDQFRREILLDTQRLKNVLEETESAASSQPRKISASRGVAGWKGEELGREIIEQFSKIATVPADRNGTYEVGPRRVKLQAGETIYRQGDQATDLYVILKGRVKTSIKAGLRGQTMSRLTAGSLLGETVLLDEPHRTEHAEAEEDCELICLQKDEFVQIIGSELTCRIIMNLVEKLRDSVSVVEGSLFEDILSKLIYGLIFFYRRSSVQNGQTIALTELTDLLGLKDDGQISRYINKLESLNILRVEENSVRISNLGKLENLLNLLSRPGRESLTL